MPIYKIRGIDVDFPFEAYDCQLVYMEKVIQSLQERCNALLESPTGTGKTLCLLCATLAWRKSLGGFSSGSTKVKFAKPDCDGDGEMPSQKYSQPETSGLPTIVYTSRTHSQLRQVIQELKRSNYRPKMVVLGSREQLCIHDDVSLLRGKAQNNACHYLCRKRRCKHNIQVADYMKHNPYLGDEPVDIEDLVKIGKQSGTCPYYLSRELHKSVDIIFAPYNYLIDNGNRKSLSLDWKKSVLIFDEAHNLESLCAEAASFDLPSGLLATCISEAKNCVDLAVARRAESSDKSCNPDNFAILRALLLKLEKRIAEVPIESKDFGFTKPGPYIYELFSDLNVTHETASMLIGTIEEAAVLLEESKQLESKNTMSRLETMGDILKLVFREDSSHAKYYRVHVREVDPHPSDGFKGKPSRSLSWWCFNPGIAMEEFTKIGVGSIILTSGTLSPLDSFAQELNLEFPVRLENPHVISSNQLWAGVVSAGPSGCSFNSSYRNRESLEYKQELGNAIVNFARIVPDGLLVFFPSYYILDQCIGCWKNQSSANSKDSSTIWERICKYKKPVVEPRQSSLFILSIEDYMSKIKDTSSCGAVFFAVCRGKVSEGLDFADHAGRAVVVTGLPFATRTDPKVRLKREYLDEHAWSRKGAGKVFTGEEWYTQQASRAVNQAVGRVIRHRDDYGAIIFCDERFANEQRQSQVSRWIQPHIKCYPRFGDAVFALTRFFRDSRSLDCKRINTAKTADNDNAGDTQTVHKLEKQPTQLVKSAVAEPDYSAISMPSSSKHKGRSITDLLGDVVPANRSSLTPDKKFLGSKWSSPADFVRRNKKLGNTNTLGNHEVVELTDDSLLDRKPNKETITPCCTKKRKLSNTEMLQCGNCHEESAAMEDPQSDRNFGVHNAQVGSASGSQPTSDDEEMKGSAFLIQVQEKLSAAEYKEFVGFMRALKSKAMKIGYVLQSIARLFAAPDRLTLSRRFKDFIPAKYQPLYEQYLGGNNGTTSNG